MMRKMVVYKDLEMAQSEWELCLRSHPEFPEYTVSEFQLLDSGRQPSADNDYLRNEQLPSDHFKK